MLAIDTRALPQARTAGSCTKHIVQRRGFVVRYRPGRFQVSDFTPEMRSEVPPTPDPTDFTLGGYTGPSRAIEGIGFWPRVAARLIDIVVMTFLGSVAGALFALIAKYRAAGV